jgi:hypothetical protein
MEIRSHIRVATPIGTMMSMGTRNEAGDEPVFAVAPLLRELEPGEFWGRLEPASEVGAAG